MRNFMGFESLFSSNSSFQSNLLFVRDVPFELKGRQRAEFTVKAVDIQNPSNHAQTNVTVDLLLPDAGNESSATTSGSGIARTSQSTDETPVFDSTPDLSPTSRPDTLPNVPTETPVDLPNLTPRTPRPAGFGFKHPLYTAMLPERQYGNRGSVVNLRPEALKEVRAFGGYLTISFRASTTPSFQSTQTGVALFRFLCAIEPAN
jgi:hypothetical protein